MEKKKHAFHANTKFTNDLQRQENMSIKTYVKHKNQIENKYNWYRKVNITDAY